MKLYHFALLFAVIACGSFVVIQVALLNERKKEELRQTERDCLAFAADDMAKDLFAGANEEVSMQEVNEAGEVFFQSLALCRNGAADVTTKEYWKRKVVLFVYEKSGYYRFTYGPEKEDGWEFSFYGDTTPEEEGIIIPSVAVVFTIDGYGTASDSRGELYVASGITETKYYVTEDGHYHRPECVKCGTESVLFCYATMRACAEQGAFPCEECLN